MTAPAPRPSEAAELSQGAAARVTVSCVSIRDFRNLGRADIPLPDDGIAVIGDNGHGKTNLLEALTYLSLFRSMRGVRDRDVLRFGAQVFNLSAEACRARVGRVSVGVDRTGGKRVLLDGVEAARLSDALGAIPSVCFSPADVALISGGPASRRRYLDIALALSSTRYLTALRHYRAALTRRNAALRNGTRAGTPSNAVAAWEPALARHGAVILEERYAWVSAIEAPFGRLCASIGEQAPMRIAYASQLMLDVAPSELGGALAAALVRTRATDARRGMTQVGPHRDDLAVTLGGRDLRLVGSAGQHRTAAIALRLLEAGTYRDRGGAQPLLLLDDPFAELDRTRAGRVLTLLDQLSASGLAQTVLCVPREDEIPAAFTRLERWRIRDGVLERL